MTRRGEVRKLKVEEISDVPVVQSLRSQLTRLTEERLRSSAIELFARHGYRATTVAEIAKAAGTTPTTFYRYFNSKLDIARLLQNEINVEVTKTLDQLDEVKRPTRHAVRGWVDKYDQMWQRMHVLCDALWEATSTDAALAAELVPVTFRLTENMKLIKSLPEGEARNKLQTRLVMLYMLMDRVLYLVNAQGRNPLALRMLDEFSEIFRGALFGSEK